MGLVERKVAGGGRGSVRAGPGPNWGEATNCSPAHNATTAWRPIAGVEVPLGGEMVLGGGERRAEKTLQLGGSPSVCGSGEKYQNKIEDYSDFPRELVFGHFARWVFQLAVLPLVEVAKSEAGH